MHPRLLPIPAILAAASLISIAAPAPPPATRPNGPAPARGPAVPTDQPAPRSQASWMNRHNGLVETAKKGDIDLYFEGDSITDFWVNGRQGNAAPGKVIWDKQFAPWKAGDFGISGDTTQMVLYRIENGELDGVHPKAVVLMIGTNNAPTNTAEEIAKGVAAIVNVFKEKVPQAKILLLAIFPRNATAQDPLRIKLNQANDMIAKLDDGKNVKFMNINDKFLDQDGNLSTDIMPDRLHPNEKGYQIWADAITPQLTAWLGPLPATQPAAK